MKSRFTAFCVALLTVFTATADEADRVGALGVPARLEINGVTTFTADEIRKALFDEFDVVAACDENAPQKAFLSLLAEKMIAGYKCAGFPDVTVAVVAADGKVTATIKEGDRYLAGEVVVTGNDLLDPAQLKDKLTESSGSKRAIWQAGEPAWFNGEYQAWLKSKVAELIGDQGHYEPKLAMVVEPDRANQTATLKIEIADEGLRTTLRDFALAGAERDSREALVAYLGLDEQVPLTGETRGQIVERLLASGRYAQVQWNMGEPGQRSDAWQPILQVREYEEAPPVGDPVTREEAALLKLAEWVARFEQSDEELLIRFPDQNVSVIFAPQQGFIITLDSAAGVPGDGGTAATRSGFVSAIVMAEERVGLYSSAQRKKVDAAPPPAPMVGNAQITLVDGSPAWDGRGRLLAGTGLRSVTSKAHRRHVKMQLTLTAAAALSVVRTHEAKSHWDGDVVCFEWKNRKMRINSVTGQLLEQSVTEAPSGEADDADFLAIEITLTSGCFQGRLAEIEKTGADWPNMADGKRPLSCVGEFLCEKLKQLDATSRSAYAALGTLLARDMLQPLDELICQACRPAAAGFVIPQAYFYVQFNSFDELVSQSPMLARALGMRLGNHLFPGDGWLNGLWREGVFLLADGRTEASDDLSCQPARDRGAVCALAAAEILNAAGCNELSPRCARRGLRRLSGAAFHEDCRELLSGDGIASQCLLQAAGALRQLDAEETNALVAMLTRFELLDAGQSASFEQFMSALRTAKGDSPAQVAGMALDSLWRAGLSGWVEHRLRDLAEPPVPAEIPYAYAPGEPLPPGAAAYGAAPTTVNGGPIFGQLYVPGDSTRYYPGTEPPTVPKEHDLVEPGEGAKSLNEEVRELKWLAQALTGRLEKLEERLHAQSREPDRLRPVGGEKRNNATTLPFRQQPDGFGLDRCCPVTLVEKRLWRFGDVKFGVVHRGKIYLFVDEAAQKTFQGDPDRYTPVLNGDDAVVAVDQDESVAGQREYGVFYQDRVYLFSSEESLQTFNNAPETYAAAAARVAVRRARRLFGSAVENK